jgi:hypothetical protein
MVMVRVAEWFREPTALDDAETETVSVPRGVPVFPLGGGVLPQEARPHARTRKAKKAIGSKRGNACLRLAPMPKSNARMGIAKA